MKNPATRIIRYLQNVQATIFIFIAAVTLNLLCVSDAQAHKINLFCRFEGTTLHGEAYFSGGDPVRNSSISIYALDSGKQLASGVTSSEGTFTLPLEKRVPVKAVLEAGHGHRASWTWDRKDEQAESQEPPSAETENPLTVIAAGLAVIAVFFGFLYLWKRRDAA